MYACKWLGAIILCLTATLAQGAGIRAIDIPASADGPALKGAVWYPCVQSPEKVDLGKITLGKEFPGQPVTHDPRIKAAVIADPLTVFFTPNSFGAVGIPVQLWASELGVDGVLPHTADIVDKSLPSKHEYRVVPNAGHFAFLAPCPPALAKEVPLICVDANGFDRVAFHRQFNADVLVFFRTHLTNAPQ